MAPLKSLLSKAKSKSKTYLLGLAAGTATLCMLYGILNFSQFHRNYLRNKVGANVVEVVAVNQAQQILGGGTGFIVNTPHGKQYILTNAHVCNGVKDDDNNVKVILPDGSMIPERVISISPYTDLCLIEAPTGFSGLNMASSISIGQEISLVGHPELEPLTMTTGEVISFRQIETIDGVIDGKEFTEDMCKLPKNKIENIELNFFGIKLKIELCASITNSYHTTLVGLPGNSGSPVVNWWGNVVGVLFAGDDRVFWSDVVTLRDAKDFLAQY